MHMNSKRAGLPSGDRVSSKLSRSLGDGRMLGARAPAVQARFHRHPVQYPNRRPFARPRFL
jgi:hypothetical protein